MTTPADSAPPEPRAVAEIIRRHALMAAGVGLVPLPAVDFVGTTAVVMRMLRRLAAHYEVEFFPEAARAALSALLGGGAATMIAFGPARAAAVAIPGVGVAAAMALGSASASALVYALGRIFAQHFGRGGTLHDFDPERHRDDLPGRRRAEAERP